MKTLEGKTALVTGASRGIGRAISLKLAEAGANIAALDIDEEPLTDLGKEVKEFGVGFLPLVADVSKLDEMESCAKQVVETFGTLDILVNNAGITRDNLLIRMSEQEWSQVLAINLTGVYNGTKAVARIMMKQRSGRIVNMASVVGLIGNAGQANYAASKAGVIGLTKANARELAKRNITVNAVAPGFIKTRMTDKLTDEAREALSANIPLGRLGEPEDVAEVVLFLASPAAGYITGQVICVDGGMVM